MPALMYCILKSVAAWVLFGVVGANLIGFVVRALLWLPPPPADYEVRQALRREIARMELARAAMTLGSALVLAAYLFVLFYFWNAALALAAATLMAARIPDLLWEIRVGRKPTREERPRGGIHTVASILIWAALLLTWYSLCRSGT